VDAPSGLGFNAAMDVIDTLLGWVKLRKNSGGAEFSRGRINLIEGSGITLTVADDAGNNEVDVTVALGPSLWSDWTPVLQGSGGNPTLGTGSVQVGRQATMGNLVVCWGTVIAGTSGFVNGSGDILINLPVTAASIPTNGKPVVGAGWIFDSSAVNMYTVTVELSSTTQARLRVTAVGSSVVTWTAPFTAAASDQFNFQLTYEKA
jgi:hypothetical protein